MNASVMIHVDQLLDEIEVSTRTSERTLQQYIVADIGDLTLFFPKNDTEKARELAEKLLQMVQELEHTNK